MSAYVDGLMQHGGPGQYRGAGARVGARNGHRWCHLYADTEEELHAFAARIGMRRSWAQVSRRGIPHYDLVPGRRTAAVAAGAIELGRTEARRLREQLRPSPSTPNTKE